MQFYDSLTGVLQPYEYLSLDAYDNHQTVVSGYFYTLLAPDSVTVIGYWGLDSNMANNYSGVNFDYTLLLQNNNKTCYPAVTEVKELGEYAKVTFHPNPVIDEGVLSIYSERQNNVKISLLDVTGKFLKNVYDGIITEGTANFDIRMANLADGIYFISVNLGMDKKVIKVSKVNGQ